MTKGSVPVPDGAQGPLHGVKVVEFGNLIAGPYCAMLLADLGADVIKIEPRSGDLSRAFGPYVGDKSYYFEAINRGKRSVVVDPRHEGSRDWVRKLCAEADVVVHNLRFGAMQRMRLGYDDLVDHNPGLIYAEVSAFGATGPMAQRPGIDNIFQGESGMMSLSGAEGDGPAKTATTVGDYLAGTNAALSISAALAGRAATGEGMRVDVSLRDGLIAIQSTWNAMYFADGEQPGRIGTGSWFTGPTDTFATSDGHLNIAIVSDRHFAILCEEVGLDIVDDERYSGNALRVDHRLELHEAFAPIFAAATTDEWVERLGARGLPVGRLMTLPEVFDDAQVRHNEMRVVLGDGDDAVPVTGSPLRLGGNPAIAGAAAPNLGADTAAVLSDLGAGEDQIADLIERGLAYQG